MNYIIGALIGLAFIVGFATFWVILDTVLRYLGTLGGGVFLVTCFVSAVAIAYAKSQ